MWANPLWEALSFEVTNERKQIQDMVETFGHTLPTYNITWKGTFVPSSLPDAVLQQGRYRRKLRSIRLELAYYAYLLGTNRGFGLAVLVIFAGGCSAFVLWKGCKEAWTCACAVCRVALSWSRLAWDKGFSQACWLGSCMKEQIKQHTEWIRDYGFELVQSN